MEKHVYQDGDILIYVGYDERSAGQTLVLDKREPWEYTGQDVWSVRDTRQGVFTEEYLQQEYAYVGNINEVDGVDVDD